MLERWRMMTNNADKSYKRIIIVIGLALGMLLAALDTMIVSTAMPEISSKLGGASLYSWVFSAYMLTSTVTVPLYGKMADMIGRKKVYLFALLVFLMGSILCGFANTMWQLVVFRAIQGIGAGGVIPLAVTIAGDLYTVEKRGKIQGLFSTMWAVAGISGPVIGGWMVEHFHWSWIFWINAPVGLLAVVGTLLFHEQVQEKRIAIDLLGVVLLTSSITFFLFATLSKNLLEIAGLLLLCGLLLWRFIVVEKRSSSPLIQLSLFKNPMIKWVNLTTVLVTMGTFALPSFIPLFAQDVLDFNPMMSGLVLLGQVAGWNLMSIPTGKLILRYGYKNLIVVGILFLTLSMVFLFFMGEQMGFWLLTLDMFFMGLGFGLSMTSFIIGVQEAVGWNQRGISTSIQMFSRSIGQTVGITMIGWMMNLFGDQDQSTGFHAVFLVALTISLVSLAISLKIPVKQDYVQK
ncbi:MAG TPA: major facilitator superfamily transporter [Paenibacillaceae bacterium]|nr:major facilitator superfamily transporter [Paenibacillaceae bacterium]